MKYTSVIQCAIQTMRQEAASGFFKGMFFPFMATGFLHSIYFTGYRITIQLLNPKVAANSHYVPKHSHVRGISSHMQIFEKRILLVS